MTESPPENQAPKKSTRLILAGILALALALRLANLDATSLWLDEIYSLMTANVHLRPETLEPVVHSANWHYRHSLAWQPMNWEDLLALLRINVHMPLYYLLLNPWLSWFGNDAWGLRSFSALFSLLMLLPLYWLGKSLGGTRAGLLAAFAGAVAPFQLYYAQEGRMYTLSLFWAVLSALSYWKTLDGKHPLRWSLLYAVSIAGGLLSHYMFIFFLGFQAVHGLFRIIRGNDRRRCAYLGFGLLSALLVAVAWYPVYLAQQQGVNEEYHFAKGLVPWLRYPTQLVWQPLLTLAGDNRLERLFYLPFAASLLIVPLWQNAKAFFISSRKPVPRQTIAETKTRFQHDELESPGSPIFTWRREGFLLCWLLAPLLFQIGYDLVKQTHTSVIDRYTLLISPAMLLWLGLTLDAWMKRSRWVSALLAAMLCLGVANVACPSPFRDEHNKRDIRGKINFMVRNARPDDLIVANGPYGVQNLAAYYLARQRPQQPILFWINAYRGNPVPLPDAGQLKPYRRVWLFRYRANNERGLQRIKDHLKSRYPVSRQERDWFIYSRP